MVMLIETMVQLGDVRSCAVLREKLARHAGTNVTTGSGLLCFGRVDRYLGMLSFTVGELEARRAAARRRARGRRRGRIGAVANESRLWLSRVRRAQGHAAEAEAMARVVVRRGAGRTAWPGWPGSRPPSWAEQIQRAPFSSPPDGLQALSKPPRCRLRRRWWAHRLPEPGAPERRHHA